MQTSLVVRFDANGENITIQRERGTGSERLRTEEYNPTFFVPSLTSFDLQGYMHMFVRC